MNPEPQQPPTQPTPPYVYYQQPPPPAVVYVQPTPPAPTNGLATGAMVSGIIAIPLLICCYIGIAPGIVAIILGHIAYAKSNQLGGEGRTYSLVALACGYGTVAIMPILLIFGSLAGALNP